MGERGRRWVRASELASVSDESEVAREGPGNRRRWHRSTIGGKRARSRRPLPYREGRFPIWRDTFLMWSPPPMVRGAGACRVNIVRPSFYPIVNTRCSIVLNTHHTHLSLYTPGHVPRNTAYAFPDPTSTCVFVSFFGSSGSARPFPLSFCAFISPPRPRDA